MTEFTSTSLLCSECSRHNSAKVFFRKAFSFCRLLTAVPSFEVSLFFIKLLYLKDAILITCLYIRWNMTNRTVSIKITKSTSVKGLFHSYTRLLSYEIQQTQLANLQIRLYLLKCARQKRLTNTPLGGMLKLHYRLS